MNGLSGLNGRQSSYAWKWKMPVAAEVVGEELGKLEEEYGAVTPAVIVDSAKVAASPLHPLFTWDDSVAGPKYRLTEASFILRNLVIRTASDNKDDDTPKHRTVRAYLSVPSNDEDGDGETEDDALPPRTVYVSTQAALMDATRRAYILKEARNGLEAWRNKYFNLTEFAELITAIDETLRKFTNEVKVN